MKNFVTLCYLLAPIALFAQLPQNITDYSSLILSQNTGLKQTDLAEMKISSQSVDNQNGVTHVYFNQYYKTIPIHNAVMGLHLNNAGKIVALNNSFVKNLEANAASSTPVINANDAALFALSEKNINFKISPIIKPLEKISSNEVESIFINEALAQGDIKVHLTWVAVNGILKLTWNVNWLTKDEQNWWNVRVDAISGKVLDENNWIAQCEGAKNQELNSKDQIPSLKFQIPNSKDQIPNSKDQISNFISPKADPISSQPGYAEGMGEGKNGSKYKVLARPVESPSHGNMSVLIDPSDSLSSPFSWHDDNGATGAEYTITRGNNVYATEDKNSDNQPGYSPDGGSSLNFDFPFDKTKRHTDYLDAAITNLFYWNNLMHDVWYHYGFDDASGNFQVNNYGRGGAGSDEVSAEAQDGSGTNNANFGTPPDGQNPRMQMYVWNVNSAAFLLRITQPSGIAKQYTSLAAGFGPKLTITPITGNIILADDGSSTPTLACADLINGNDINNQIALIDRGNCKFAEKVKFAEDMGAKAVIIINNVTGNPFTMGGDGVTVVNIPSIMISKANGDILKNALKTGIVKGSLYDSIGAGGKQYDSDFDNGIICHEYGHGISNRLTGGAANTNCLTNEEQMGEGWSDFFGLVLTHKPVDKGPDRRGIGTYVIDQANTGDGIREFPYSTSLAINPVTYNDIKSFSVPHGVGSVWCSMLWDMYWDLIDKYGYDADIYYGKGGNNIAMKLVIDGLKMQPCNPGFEDGRDAILLADRLNNKGVNQELIWKSFARRGLGFGASQGSNNSRSDGTESFDIPKFDLPTILKTAIAETKNGDTLIYKIVLKNLNPKSIYALTFNDTLKTGLQFIKAIGFSKGSFNNPVYSAIIDSMKTGDSIVSFIHTKVNTTLFTSYLETTDFEIGAGSWKDSSLLGTGAWVARTNKKYNGAKSYFISNQSVQSDKILTKSFNLNLTNPHLIFYHLYNTEADWDGGVIEINKNGIWEDLGPQMIENGYNKMISINDNSNISGQPAFTGNSVTFIRTIVDLSPYKNDSAKIRFRFVSDAAQGAEGWYIDDVSLVEMVNVKNAATVRTSSASVASNKVYTVVLKGNNVSISLPKLTGFSVSPNPFNDQIVINSTNTNYKLSLLDVLGKIIIQNNNATNSSILETSALSTGTYFLKIETDNGMDIIKLVK